MTDRGRGARGLLALAAVFCAVAWSNDRLTAWIAETEIPVLVHATAPEVRDRNGTLLRAYTIEDGLWRMAVTPDQVDPLFYEMLVAYEDKRFYRHSGIDPWASARAVLQALREGRVVSGASTLTMQVARLLEDGTTGQWQGKLRQMRLAMALEQRLTKDEILALYTLIAPYGGNVEGLRAAAYIWLGKTPRRLTPAEAALLVALPQAPESRRPDRHPEAARLARNRVLVRMAKAGVIPMSAAQSDQLDPAPLGRHPMPQLAPHMADRAIAEGAQRVDLTLDATLQKSIEALVTRHVARLDPRLSMAVILADHTTGEILASVGSPNYTDTLRQGFVDMTQAQRSPGSTLKPFVYGLAFDRGLAHPQTLILDTPVQFGSYAPENFDGAYRGELTVRRALQLSLNVPVVRLTEALGPAHLLAALQRADVAPGLQGGAPGLALSLGGVGVTLEEMVQLYAALANGGKTQPLVWQQAGPMPAADQRLMSRAAAWHLGDMLSDLAPPPAAGPKGRVAYKTGTSYGHRDAWALGWTGQHVAGVWIGRPDGTPVPGAFGGALAAPALFEVLSRASPRLAPLPPPPPETLIVSNARLPAPLQRFGTRVETPSLQLTFPPDGARLDLSGSVASIPVKLRGGAPPYTLLADGAVVATGLRRPVLSAPALGPGFTTLTVIDSTGQSERVTIEVR